MAWCTSTPHVRQARHYTLARQVPGRHPGKTNIYSMLVGLTSATIAPPAQRQFFASKTHAGGRGRTQSRCWATPPVLSGRGRVQGTSARSDEVDGTSAEWRPTLVPCRGRARNCMANAHRHPLHQDRSCISIAATTEGISRQALTASHQHTTGMYVRPTQQASTEAPDRLAQMESTYCKYIPTLPIPVFTCTIYVHTHILETGASSSG